MSELDIQNLGERLSAFLDGELEAAEAEEVRRLLASSATARRMLEELRDVSQRLHALPRVAAPSKLAEYRQRWESPARGRGLRLTPWSMGGIGIAASVLMLGVGTWIGWSAHRYISTAERELRPAGNATLNFMSTTEAAKPADRSAPELAKGPAPVAVELKAISSPDTGVPVAGWAAGVAPGDYRKQPGLSDETRERAENQLQLGAVPLQVDDDTTPVVACVIAPPTADDYRRAADTINAFAVANLQPPFSQPQDAAVLSLEKEEEVEGEVDAPAGTAPTSAGNAFGVANSNGLTDVWLNLSVEQAAALMRTLDEPLMQNARVQVAVRGDQMADMEPLVTAGNIRRQGIDLGTYRLRPAPRPYAHPVPDHMIPPEYRQSRDLGSLVYGGENAGRRAAAASRPAENGGVSGAPATQAASNPANSPAWAVAAPNAVVIEKQAASQAAPPIQRRLQNRAVIQSTQGQMGPPLTPNSFVQLRLTLLPPVEPEPAASAPASQPATEAVTSEPTRPPGD